MWLFQKLGEGQGLPAPFWLLVAASHPWNALVWKCVPLPSLPSSSYGLLLCDSVPYIFLSFLRKHLSLNLELTLNSRWFDFKIIIYICEILSINQVTFTGTRLRVIHIFGGNTIQPGTRCYYSWVCVCVCVCAHSIDQSCLTLCNPMDCSLSGSSVQGSFQARILELVTISSSRGSFQSRDRICISCVSCISRQMFYHWVTWESC